MRDARKWSEFTDECREGGSPYDNSQDGVESKMYGDRLAEGISTCDSAAWAAFEEGVEWTQLDY